MKLEAVFRQTSQYMRLHIQTRIVDFDAYRMLTGRQEWTKGAQSIQRRSKVAVTIGGTTINVRDFPAVYVTGKRLKSHPASHG
jgi:hypothetical protein